MARSLRYFLPSYATLVREFRNGLELSWAHLYRTHVNRAVFWDGHEIRNAGERRGFVETIVEMWGLREYTNNGFYSPKDGDVVLDVGANIGLFSIWLARRAPGARVLAFEPFEENYATLESNLAGWRHSVQVHRAALGGTAGVGSMLDVGERSLDHRLTMEQSGGSPVRVITLNEAVEMTDSETIDLLKIDIEGAEADVLEAALPATLGRVRRIALEYHDNIRPGTCAFVRQVLSATHRIVGIHGSPDGYGILHAERF